MAEYKHGIRVFETDTQLEQPAMGYAGLQVVVGTAPINLAKNPRNTTNKLILCRDFDSAKNELGFSENYKDYTLCQSMHMSFRVLGVAPVVFINVLDPVKHKVSMSEKTVNVVNKKAELNEKDILLDTLVVKSGSNTLANNTDYLAFFKEDGTVVITLIPGSAHDSSTELKITADKINPAAVTVADIVGGYDAVHGKETGVELVRRVFPALGIVPGLLLAPGWSHDKTVAAALQGKCEKVNGKFRCMCLIDISTVTASKYTDVGRAKAQMGVTSKYAICLYPAAKTRGKVVALSAVAGALCTRLDIDNSDIPVRSISNKVVAIDSACLADGTEVMFDEIEGNAINAEGVVTIINQVGLRLWGNETAAYPSTVDPKDRWISVRRMFNWYENGFITRFLDRVDEPANYKMVESFIDNENITGNALVADDKLAGARFEFDPEDNPVSQILAGEIKFKEKIAPYTPGQYIENTFSFDPRMIESAIGGGE
nr:MAG TPA: tail sheath tube [Caudoviricetes sp.]